MNSELKKNKDVVDVLLIDDNPADARLCMTFISNPQNNVIFHHVSDGEEALDFIYKRHQYATAPTPRLVLLDLNIPRISGLDILQELKGNPKLKVIPVVVLTSSESQRDLFNCYAFGANSVLIKALDLESVATMYRVIESFWLQSAKLLPNTETVEEF